MSNLAFVTHPSVRIKGSENVYTPVGCVDDLCPISMPHLHCPFCVKSDSYTDPVILKAHYRVKHVDKGIEFAGLKILRCCKHCDIVGVIKGEKKFKGAHWHCYRCRNGFNRRDEAIKHYKTHFRNPQTTFQISITQEVNSPVAYYQDTPRNTVQQNSGAPTSQGDGNVLNNCEIIHPALTEAVSCISSPTTQQDISSNSISLTNGKAHDGTVHVSIEAACDSVDVGEDNEEAIIVIQEEQLETSEIDSSFPTHIVNNESVESEKERQDKGSDDLSEKVQQLEQDKAILKAEITRLHKHIDSLEDTIRTSQKKEEELSARLGKATERGMAEMLKRMEADHKKLLRQQLDTLQQAFHSSRSPSSTVLQLTDQNGQEIQVVNAASLEAFLASAASEGQSTLPTTTIIQAGDLSLEQISGGGSSVVTSCEGTKSTSSVDLGSGIVMCVQGVKTEKEESNEESYSATIKVTESSQPPSKKQKTK